MMKLSDARTAVRTRIRDTVTTYEYYDANLDSYLEAAIRAIAGEIRSVDPDFFLTSVVVRGYTDALDPADSGGYEFYPLPKNHVAIRWIERNDITPHYPLFEASARDQEEHRYTTRLGAMRASIVGSSDASVALNPTAQPWESAVVLADRFRVLPAPTAAGPEYRVWFDEDVAYPKPVGDNELIRIPPTFHEPFLRTWGVLVVGDDGDEEMTGRLEKTAGDHLAVAKKEFRKRRGRTTFVAPAW